MATPLRSFGARTDAASEADASLRERASPGPTVLLTAGASAPEDLVAEICRALVARYGATLEVADVFEEDVEFALPAALRRILRDKSLPGADTPVRIGRSDVTPQAYGAVPLTVENRHLSAM